jgi:hypothetical protein
MKQMRRLKKLMLKLATKNWVSPALDQHTMEVNLW